VYSSPGRYNVLLIVTDDDGAADTRSRTAEPSAPPAPEPNKAPRADFDVRCEHLTCSFTDKSKDDDGTIVSRSWSFGDGSTSSDQNPVHTYSEKGRFRVTLTVTDDDGATATKSKDSNPKD
jgi:PKD repeat protein